MVILPGTFFFFLKIIEDFTVHTTNTVPVLIYLFSVLIKVVFSILAMAQTILFIIKYMEKSQSNRKEFNINITIYYIKIHERQDMMIYLYSVFLYKNTDYKVDIDFIEIPSLIDLSAISGEC